MNKNNGKSDSQTAELAASAFRLLKVKSFFRLFQAYCIEDQKLMKSGTWDAHNPKLVINRVKAIIERIDTNHLNEEDREWWHEIMWFWYHHAISFALWKLNDRKLANLYAIKALEYQENNPNRITKVLWFLINDDPEAARAWLTAPGVHATDLKTGIELIQDYQNGKFFAKGK